MASILACFMWKPSMGTSAALPGRTALSMVTSSAAMVDLPVPGPPARPMAMRAPLAALSISRMCGTSRERASWGVRVMVSAMSARPGETEDEPDRHHDGRTGEDIAAELTQHTRAVAEGFLDHAD